MIDSIKVWSGGSVTICSDNEITFLLPKEVRVLYRFARAGDLVVTAIGRELLAQKIRCN